MNEYVVLGKNIYTGEVIEYYGIFESKASANKMAKQLRKDVSDNIEIVIEKNN